MLMTSQPVTRALRASDVAEIARLHERVFGPGRFARTAYRVREGRRDRSVPGSDFCVVLDQGRRVVGSLNLTEVSIGGDAGALLLGPIVVDPSLAGQGFGRRMIVEALDAARRGGRRLVVLVGDAPYYGPLGFGVVPPGQITLPGPVNPARVLAAELEAGALARYRGMVVAI